MEVAVLGVGVLGREIATRLTQAGHRTVVFDPIADLSGVWANVATTAAEAVVGTDVAIIVARDDAQVRDCITGPSGVIEGLAEGGLVVIHSTISPATVRTVALDCERHGISLIDAGVTRGVSGDVRGGEPTLTLMCGGSIEDVNRLRTLASAYARRTIHVGSLGSGMSAKLIRNAMQYTIWCALNEWLRVARAVGIDDAAVREILETTGMTNLHSALLDDSARQAMAVSTASTRALVEIGDKDLGAALALADELECPAPLGAVARAGWPAAASSLRGE